MPIKNLFTFFSLLLISCSSTNSPESITEEFWQAIITKNNEEIRALISDKSAISFLDHVTYNDTPSKYLEADEVETADTFIHNNTAIVTTNFSIIRDIDTVETRGFYTTLTKIDGHWKIDLMKTLNSKPGILSVTTIIHR